MNRSDIEIKIKLACDKFQENDNYLITVDANERSMSHRIAMYIEEEFPGWNVDCEYNRDFGVPKQLELQARGQLQSDCFDTNAKTVFPDIIVHRRNSENNLLVIEIKKRNNRDRTDAEEWDKKKLLAYKKDLNYLFALLLLINTSTMCITFDFI